MPEEIISSNAIMLQKSEGFSGYTTYYLRESGSPKLEIRRTLDIFKGNIATKDYDGDGAVDEMEVDPDGPQTYAHLYIGDCQKSPAYEQMCRDAQQFHTEQIARFQPLLEDFLQREGRKSKEITSGAYASISC